MDDVTFSDWRPGGLSKLCALQSEYYAREWGFDERYESVVTGDISEFLRRRDPHWDFVQLAVRDGDVMGGIVIDSLDRQTAQLHWFILHEALRGGGIGGRLVENAMAFVRDRGFPRVFLSTFEGLDAARRLYEKAGFVLTEQKYANTWGRPVNEQRFDWHASAQA